MDGTGVAAGVDGEARELHDRRRRPHHHPIRLVRAAALHKNLPGGPPLGDRCGGGEGEDRGEEPEAGAQARRLAAGGTRAAAPGPASTARRSAATARGEGGAAQQETEKETAKATAKASFSERMGDTEND